MRYAYVSDNQGTGLEVSIVGTSDSIRIEGFFNNGNAPNSQLRVEFSDGRVLTMTLPDGSAPGSLFIFSQ